MTIREPLCLGRGGAETVPGSVLIVLPMPHSTDGPRMSTVGPRWVEWTSRVGGYLRPLH
jgi:hypothetical protein